MTLIVGGISTNLNAYTKHIQEYEMAPYDSELGEGETLLRVKAGTAPNSLAATVAHSIYNGQKPVLRAIGAGAVNQAVKAVAIAQGYVGQRGITLVMRPGFTTVKMDDGEVSAIVLKVFPD